MTNKVKKNKNKLKKQSISNENCNDKPQSDKIEISQEIGGRKGPEPTRFGDWEKNGRCIDF